MTIMNLKKAADLDVHAQEIQRTLEREDENILEKNPEIFSELIKRSSILIGSKSFIKIVEVG